MPVSVEDGESKGRVQFNTKFIWKITFCNSEFCLCDIFSKFSGNLYKTRQFKILSHCESFTGFLSFQMGKLKQREFKHQFPELKEKICCRAGNKTLSKAGKCLPYKSILPTGTQKGIIKEVVLWAGWRLHCTNLTTWCLATQPFGVLRKWLFLMRVLLSLVIFIFVVFLKLQLPDAETLLLFKRKRSFQMSALYNIQSTALNHTETQTSN